MLLFQSIATLAAIGFVHASADLSRPECTGTVPVKTTEKTVLGFDDYDIVPCAARVSTDPYSGLYFTDYAGNPVPVINTTSTINCHAHSGGGGPYGQSSSKPNNINAPEGILNFATQNGSSFSFESVAVFPIFDRQVYRQDYDPLVIGRAKGYDACGNNVAIDTQIFTEMRRGHPKPYLWNVTEPEKFVNLQRVHFNLWWWYEGDSEQDGDHLPHTKNFTTGMYFDDFVYKIDLKTSDSK